MTPRSVRFDGDVLRRLDRYVRSTPGASTSSVANQFVDEALRAEEHPGITFRSGPTGRRAALVGGPDVWEVIDTLLTLREDDPSLAEDALVTETARTTALVGWRVRVAVRYYAAFPAEIDDRIAAHREKADEAEAAWLAERALLRGDQAS
ncbi:hypothetical protein BKA01_007167 [Pseudonocardia eucalypti]|uniref:hypothetical protein n=1 Tax=Pseudonocardia eucalypti TaxID=648755 RepID=UPI0016111C6F|nr:hypothetical protein [Pseudonocardia eucalypti]